MTDLRQAIDISNYSGSVTPQQAAAIRDAGIGRVIVQLVNERTLTHREQIPALLAAGVEVMGYVYVWFSAGEQFVSDRVSWACAELDAFPGVTKTLWLDCEQSDTDDPPFDYVNLPVSPHIRAAIAAARAAGYAPGIYTAAWWWVPGASDSHEWADLPLWVAQYDDDPALTPFVAFGGWIAPEMKQYAGDVTVGGVPSVDRDSYEAYAYPPPAPTPEPAPPDLAAALAHLAAARMAIDGAVAALGGAP